jgi:hypothetical protein
MIGPYNQDNQVRELSRIAGTKSKPVPCIASLFDGLGRWCCRRPVNGL